MTALMVREREILEKYLPGLLDYLDETPLADLEGRSGDAIAKFREAGGTALIVPKNLGGLGATALDAVRAQRAIGSRSPSLGAATTMHHLSIASLNEFAQEASDDDRALIAALVEQRAVIASGFSEGNPGGSVFIPTMKATKRGDTYIINGSKKPCSLSGSMDLLTASVEVEGVGDKDGERAVALIPSNLDGVTVNRFWDTDILAGAQSDEVKLDDVEVPASFVLLNIDDDPDGIHEMTGYLWFGMLITANYLGAASMLLEKLLAADKGDFEGYTRAAADIENGMAAIESVAWEFDSGARGQDLSARLLFCRIAIRDALVRASSAAMESLGGIGFIKSPEIGYLAAAIQAYAFHPPSRRTISETLTKYHGGDEFAFV
ncbi:acyl-CoA/acyl-ACP dehydrogenase [Rhodococcus sp. BP-252]|uniref:Isobutylamine N-hydroxylase n=1 Tax=Rhodococcoides kyotonense TaxID=398843 RepID=A0A177Y6V9_9NOCA|nr:MULTISPECIES: acyl-CoA dehydrogenase family protein [Rhodococcus]MBY6413827.1 acyl-CoA/acyl-ACP dehydrogenase [Rhodococcus sp. BP-320]MBY6419247.1 acyl-CoA/acyl-ACP dehydrogenase [Rhodococcus sp. BP-321]MBY6424102.1 acyl-CoA/acyl-ACP dehydrogenase [Rhodococcus sp. BP-324]MBY6428600.1 acyl-CoA/acyl-ACP dehydrogenase [Rhodococcus sp. BP-323]MBY6434352.1 acyl-CoA/acyl-ACP dehydrogenase [Rhodococcus sp. BP-322]